MDAIKVGCEDTEKGQETLRPGKLAQPDLLLRGMPSTVGSTDSVPSVNAAEEGFMGLCHHWSPELKPLQLHPGEAC